MRSHRITAMFVLALAVSLPSSAMAAVSAGPCPADLDCDGAINVQDLLVLLSDWGRSGTPSDLNSDGTVDVQDLLVLLGSWGPCLHDFGPAYENAEAHQIGLEMILDVGPLSQVFYDRIDRDLMLIRKAVPALADQFHTMAWAPTQLIVLKPVDVPHSHEYQCLNAYYQVVNESIIATFGNTRYWLLTFADKLNPEALVPVYGALPDVMLADPNHLLGGQNFWTPSLTLTPGVWRWEIDDGWHDCFDGCDCHIYYTIETNEAGDVNVISAVPSGLPWCEFPF